MTLENCQYNTFLHHCIAYYNSCMTYAFILVTSIFHVTTGGNLREFTDEESNFAALLQRAMDLEGVDRETIHLLVSLLMKVRFFFANFHDILVKRKFVYFPCIVYYSCSKRTEVGNFERQIP